MSPLAGWLFPPILSLASRCVIAGRPRRAASFPSWASPGAAEWETLLPTLEWGGGLRVAGGGGGPAGKASLSSFKGHTLLLEEANIADWLGFAL